MRRAAAWLAAGALLGAVACVDNTAPGNDREARLDPPERPAPTAAAEAAVSGVDVSLLHPQIMTDADRGAVPGPPPACTFRFTRVGYPVFLYATGPGGSGTIKLNGKLVTLPATSDGVFADGGVSVRVRMLEAEGEGQRPAELVLRLPGARNELGYHGFTECGGAATGRS